MDKRSERNLEGVRPQLVNIVRRAYELMQDREDGLSFIVTEGLRDVTRQAQMVKAGLSRTMHSYHLDGRAVDVAATLYGEVKWDWPAYEHIAVMMKQAAREQGVILTWGGDWRTFKDGPHFQIEESPPLTADATHAVQPKEATA